MKRRGIFTIGAITTILVASAVSPVAASHNPVPSLGWAHGFGDATTDSGDGVAVDADGNVVATGRFEGTVDFDPGPGTHNLTSDSGSADVFVVKLDPAGNLVWAHGFGADGSDQGFGVAIDSDGNVIVTGTFSGTVDFDPGSDTRDLTSNSDSTDFFVLKLDPAGNLVWAHGFGGWEYDTSSAVAVDGDGNVVVTGSFSYSVDFDPGPETKYLSTGSGSDDAFVLKLDAAGNYLWAHGFGNGSTDWHVGRGAAFDAQGNVILTGRFYGTVDFDPDPVETHNLTSNSSSNSDVFAVKLDPAGNLVWAHGFGTASNIGGDSGEAVAVDAQGNVILTGWFYDTADFDPGPGTHNLTSKGGFDVFVVKLDAAGNLRWAHGFGDTSSDWGVGTAVDAHGNVLVTGQFRGTVDFDPGPGTHNLTSDSGAADVSMVKLDPAGNLVWAHGFGGTGSNQGSAVAVDARGYVIVTGYYRDTVDFDPGPGTHNLTSSSSYSDMFIVKLEPGSPAVGLVDPTQGQWHLRNHTGAVTSFYFGNPGDYPIMGDWNCNGIDTPGMYRQSDGYVYLRNTNTQGIANIRFFFGNPGDIPIVGDFNNNGCDTVSIYRPSNQTFYIINALGANDGGLGAAQFSYVFGNPGDKPFTGDFNGNGQTTVGLHREATGFVYFRNTHTQGNADNQFFFGDPNDRFITGDWNTNGTDTPGIFRPSNTTFYFRHTNTQGNADAQFIWGSSGWLPVSGNFGLG